MLHQKWGEKKNQTKQFVLKKKKRVVCQSSAAEGTWLYKSARENETEARRSPGWFPSVSVPLGIVPLLLPPPWGFQTRGRWGSVPEGTKPVWIFYLQKSQQDPGFSLPVSLCEGGEQSSSPWFCVQVPTAPEGGEAAELLLHVLTRNSSPGLASFSIKLIKTSLLFLKRHLVKKYSTRFTLGAVA